jgi:DNA-binding HxlR family transcriptional regulator
MPSSYDLHMAARGGGATRTTRVRVTRVATVAPPAPARGRSSSGQRPACCSLYHRAIELVGKRWTGAILLVLLDGPAHFSEIRELVPDISDRLLSERLKELESEGIVERRVLDGSPIRVEYAMTGKGRALEPAVRAMKSWANKWLAD